jgi:hypothetical protein
MNEPDVDKNLIVQKLSFDLDARFKSKSDEVISTVGSWIITHC